MAKLRYNPSLPPGFAEDESGRIVKADVAAPAPAPAPTAPARMGSASATGPDGKTVYFKTEEEKAAESKIRTPQPPTDSIVAGYEALGAAPDRDALRSQALRDVQTQLDAIGSFYTAQKVAEQARLDKLAGLRQKQVSALGLQRGLAGSSVTEAEKGQQADISAEQERIAMQKLAAAQAAEESAARGQATQSAETTYQTQLTAANQANLAKLRYLASLKPGEAQKGIEVDGKLVNPVTGEVIYSGETAPGGGLSPIANSVKKNPRILASLTASQQGEILNELAAAGEDINAIVSAFGGLSEEQMKMVNTLNQQFSGQQIVKDYSIIASNAASIEDIVTNGVGGPADLAVVFQFMKSLDPKSVVRESEYDSAAQSGNIFKGWAAKFNGYLNPNGGFLPDEVKNEFLSIAKSQMEIKKKAYEQIRNEYGKQIDRMTGGTNGTDYIFDFTVGSQKPEPAGQGDFTQPEYTKEWSDETGSYLQVGNTVYKDMGNDDFQPVGNAEIPKGNAGGLSATSAQGKADSERLAVTYPTGITKQGGSAAWRNNNPLNIKFGNFALGYNAFAGTAAADGGVFAAFPDEQTGLKAARNLLQAQSYRNLPLEQAMRRWSGNGYGADVAPQELRGKTIGQMTPDELDLLINSMSKREGWREGQILT